MKRLIAVTLATFTTIGLLSGCAQDNTEDVSRISELEAQVGSLEDSMSSLESEKEALTKARISYGNGAYKTQLRNTVAAEFEIINGK